MNLAALSAERRRPSLRGAHCPQRQNRCVKALVSALVTLLCVTRAAEAQLTDARSNTQSFDGYVSLLADAFPSVREGGDRSAVAELRPRLFAEYRRELNSRLHLTIAGFAEALIADRSGERTATASIVRPQEVSLEARWERADLRIGWSRVTWGRLDELPPTDVVNPQDLTRFFFEGRAEGRMPVAMLRGRWRRSETFSLEGIYVPVFRSGRYDQLDEESAPFNVRPRALCSRTPARMCLPVRTERLEPAHDLANAQGGMRATGTTGRVDWAVSAYRGFESLPLYEGAATVSASPSVLTLLERFPRFTMLAGDVETVRGHWGLRGEMATFVDRSLQAGAAIVKGRVVEAGVGVDRKAGEYRVSGNALLTRRAFTGRVTLPDNESDGGEIDRTDLTLVTFIDRSFAGATRTIRGFGVFNPGEQSAFARASVLMHVRDNVSLEAAVGWFAGRGSHVLARFTDRDFVYTRLKVFF